MRQPAGSGGSSSAVSSDSQTLVEAVQRWASEHGERIAFELVPASEGPVLQVSYRELDARARALAWLLSARGFAGKPVLVLCPAGFDYASALGKSARSMGHHLRRFGDQEYAHSGRNELPVPNGGLQRVEHARVFLRSKPDGDFDELRQDHSGQRAE